MTIRKLRTGATFEIHDRLAQLDRELKDERTKDYDYVWAKRAHDGIRIRICIMRERDNSNPDREFIATTTVGNHVHRAFGDRPSDAYARLIHTVRYGLDWLAARDQETFSKIRGAAA
jgi:hypothetical protein